MTEITQVKLDEMLAGLEGVTPGPWQIGKLGTEDMPHVVDFGPPPISPYMVVRPGTPAKPQMGYTGFSPSGVAHSDDNSSHANAAHIARCDPDTMRAVIALASQALRSQGEVVDEIEALIDAYWDIAFVEGESGRKTDTPEGAAQETRSAISARLAALTHPAPQEAGDVKVKDIPWTRNGAASLWSGELAFRTFYTLYDEGTGWRAFRGQFLSEAGEDEVAYVTTVEAAKSACQADFEARILSTLTEGSSR